MIGSASANALAAEADVVLAVGTRLQDFTTGSWTVFGNPDVKLIALNAARFDATKHRALAVVGDAQAGLTELSAGARRLARAGGLAARAPPTSTPPGTGRSTSTPGPTNVELPSYAHVVGAINRACDPTDLALTAAGGLPGELCKNWKAKSVGTFDCEFGFSCMGYEIAGGWGAKMADPERDVIVFTGDGSYLMLNSDIYSSVHDRPQADRRGLRQRRLRGDQPAAELQGQRVLQQPARGLPAGASDARVDFAKHAEAMGAHRRARVARSASWRPRSSAPRRPIAPTSS